MYAGIVGTGDFIIRLQRMMQGEPSIGAFADEQPMLADDQLSFSVDDGKRTGLHAKFVHMEFAGVPVLSMNFRPRISNHQTVPLSGS